MQKKVFSVNKFAMAMGITHFILQSSDSLTHQPLNTRGNSSLIYPITKLTNRLIFVRTFIININFVDTQSTERPMCPRCCHLVSCQETPVQPPVAVLENFNISPLNLARRLDVRDYSFCPLRDGCSHKISPNE